MIAVVKWKSKRNLILFLVRNPQIQTDSILRYFISDDEIYNSIKYLRDTYWNYWTCLHNGNDHIHYSTNQRESIVWGKDYLTYNPDSNFYCWVCNFAWIVLYPLPFPLPQTFSTVFLFIIFHRQHKNTLYFSTKEMAIGKDGSGFGLFCFYWSCLRVSFLFLVHEIDWKTLAVILWIFYVILWIYLDSCRF